MFVFDSEDKKVSGMMFPTFLKQTLHIHIPEEMLETSCLTPFL